MLSAHDAPGQIVGGINKELTAGRKRSGKTGREKQDTHGMTRGCPGQSFIKRRLIGKPRH
jgi:hypothetical protein